MFVRIKKEIIVRKGINIKQDKSRKEFKPKSSRVDT